jgi:hypothetical protein
MILRAMRPPATNKTPAPKANNDTISAPPLWGSSALGAGAGGGAGAGTGAGAGGASALGAGAGAGAGGGAGAGAGASTFGAGAGAGGGGGVQGALATTPPATDVIWPFAQLASAFAPPAVAVLALASATTCGLLLWAMATGAVATNIIVSIAPSSINFFKTL